MANEELQILKLLIENQEKTYSIRKIALERKINYKSAYNVILKLEKQGIIDVSRLGNINVCKFNRSFNDKVFSVEYNRRKDLFKKNKNFKIIYNDLSKINQQFIALLFGSFAKGTQTKRSDIDLLIIAEDSKKIENRLSLLPLRFHIVDITYKDFLSMLKSKEDSVVTELIKKNIILVGIEDYYRLLKNAG
tara:strand:- start:317 stop:889 length:573 start_codon:yes stop_codon:yes gene_type:complete